MIYTYIHTYNHIYIYQLHASQTDCIDCIAPTQAQHAPKMGPSYPNFAISIPKTSFPRSSQVLCAFKPSNRHQNEITLHISIAKTPQQQRRLQIGLSSPQDTTKKTQHCLDIPLHSPNKRTHMVWNQLRPAMGPTGNHQQISSNSTEPSIFAVHMVCIFPLT